MFELPPPHALQVRPLGKTHELHCTIPQEVALRQSECVRDNQIQPTTQQTRDKQHHFSSLALPLQLHESEPTELLRPYPLLFELIGLHHTPWTQSVPRLVVSFWRLFYRKGDDKADYTLLVRTEPTLEHQQNTHSEPSCILAPICFSVGEPDADLLR